MFNNTTQYSYEHGTESTPRKNFFPKNLTTDVIACVTASIV